MYEDPYELGLSVNHPEDVEESLRNYGLAENEVDLLVTTDSEGILGIGDQGVGGIDIAIGKLAVYVVGAGLHPRRVIPVVLDLGTDNLRSSVDRPIIMPLSNPTSKAEAVPEDLMQWTDGRALVATDSPFPPVTYSGRTYTIAQANNALVFPGLGLGTAVIRARQVTDPMITRLRTPLPG
jgi:malic enzyme